MGKLIVFEGLDGSGKETQSKILEKILIKKKIKVKRITYPNYTEKSSTLVKLYLDGEIDENPFNVNAFATTSFYACDHYITYKKNWEEEYLKNNLILCDRYISSNAIYQMSKLEKKEWKNFLNWLYDFEIQKLKLPKEDMVIYLDVDIKISEQLINKRNNKKDIHEKNLKYLNRCKEAAYYAAENLKWNIVKCYEKERMFSVDEIAGKIYSLIVKYI